MKKLIFILSILIYLSIFPSVTTANTTDPLNTANNKIGVHILFPSEIEQAARIVNSNNGDWGYITIPIQSGDKDLQKWQNFMDSCQKYHLIPIIRLATEGDYFNTSSWRKPIDTDVLDFANFLSSLTWPTKNHYIIVFNEVNRDNEWGGKSDPKEYANILSYAVTAFKSKNPNFFIISSGMDNAAENTSISFNEYSFFQQMQTAIPGIFNQIDGISSHSYPNPAFSSSPESNSRMSIQSFIYETELIDQFSSKKLPVFITETGWSRENLSDLTISSYFKTAFEKIWNNSRIVAVTPFLLFAASKPFQNFSLLNPDLSNTQVASEIQNIPKIAGKPDIEPIVLSAESSKKLPFLPMKKFKETKKNTFSDTIKNILYTFFAVSAW